MLFFRKLLKLPTPVDLGWSKYNALEDELFSDEPQGKTWQDWHKTVKKMHPVKYWFAETFADFVRYKLWFPIKVPLETAHYWFVSHFIPRRRYHMLDLRQPCGKGEFNEIGDCYRYGWRDVPEKMLFAIFNLLGEYLNKEQPQDLTKWYTLEQIEEDETLKRQHAELEEAKAIYQWWTVGRKEEQRIHDRLLHDWSEAKKHKSPNKDHLWEMLKQYDIDMLNKTEEMIARLMKIRRSLWT
jgi:hypothetical protein